MGRRRCCCQCEWLCTGAIPGCLGMTVLGMGTGSYCCSYTWQQFRVGEQDCQWQNSLCGTVTPSYPWWFPFRQAQVTIREEGGDYYVYAYLASTNWDYWIRYKSASMGTSPFSCSLLDGLELNYDAHSGTLSYCDPTTSRVVLADLGLSAENCTPIDCDFNTPTCDDCFIGSTPSTVTVTLSGMTGNCASSPDWNGTWVLNHQYCALWEYRHPFGSSCYGDRLRLTMLYDTATCKYKMLVSFDVNTSYECGCSTDWFVLEQDLPFDPSAGPFALTHAQPDDPCCANTGAACTVQW